MKNINFIDIDYILIWNIFPGYYYFIGVTPQHMKI